MKTLQQLCPEIGTEQLRLIWREVEGLLLAKEDYWQNPAAEQYSKGYNEALSDVAKALQAFIGAEPMLDRLNRGEG